MTNESVYKLVDKRVWRVKENIGDVQLLAVQGFAIRLSEERTDNCFAYSAN